MLGTQAAPHSGYSDVPKRVDVRTLKEVLGHENLDTTMIYTHVVDENLRDAAAKNPLAGLRPPQSAKKAQDKAK